MLNSEVMVYWLTVDEIDAVDRGEMTYSQALEGKEPSTHEENLEQFTLGSFLALRNMGYSSMWMKKNYGLTQKEYSMKMHDWGIWGVSKTRLDDE